MLNKSKVVLGINRTQDASICLVIGSQIQCAIQKERLSRTKHDWGKVGDISLYYRRLDALSNSIDLVVECYSSDVEVQKLDAYHQELRRELSLVPRCPIIQISHHLAHLYSTPAISSLRHAAVMVIDFMGSPALHIVEDWPGKGTRRLDDVEVASFYDVREGSINCIAKQMWDGNRERPVGLGCFYYYLTQLLFPGEGNEGKVMGLAPYGDPDRLHMPPLTIDEHRVAIPDEWLMLFRTRGAYDYFSTGLGSFQDCADLAACGQRAFETGLLSISSWLARRTSAPTLCYAGGAALNCVANAKLLTVEGFPEIHIPAAPHDGGTAVGCAVYGVHRTGGSNQTVEWSSDYLGPEPDTSELVRRVESAGFAWSYSSHLPALVAQLLANGKVVALYQGRSELGPRALGNRSILADPRDPAIRGWINSRVKGREAFRPLAPVVRLGDCRDYFEITRPSPFMQYAARVRPDRRMSIPAVTHVDGTARLQTVTDADNPFLASLLLEFKARTGIGVLLNTSFNGRHQPIVETVEEALEMWADSPMHALVIPPLVVSRRNIDLQQGLEESVRKF